MTRGGKGRVEAEGCKGQETIGNGLGVVVECNVRGHVSQGKGQDICDVAHNGMCSVMVLACLDRRKKDLVRSVGNWAAGGREKDEGSKLDRYKAVVGGHETNRRWDAICGREAKSK